MISISSYKNKIGRIVLLSMLGILFSTILSAQLPKATQIASKLGVGWNMGNTLEAICSETAWGAAVTTQNLIDSVKAAGFTSVRLPIAWFCHSDTTTNVIDDDWIARVKEVVDYCITADLYVIMNIHWDTGWLENRVTEADMDRVNERQNAYWTQIAEYFKDYDEHLLFAGANEPNVDDATGMSVLMTYHQTFIDAVRASEGNNTSRTLIVQGPSTDIDKTNNLMDQWPEDVIEDRLMAEVHYYTPYQFCLMEEDASWGKVFYYWGKDYHSATEPDRNANWGEEEDMERLFAMMKTKFVDQGIPVILGEFGAYKRNLDTSSDQELHNASVEYFDKFLVKTAITHGVIPFYWTINSGLFDRSTGEVVDRGVLNALMEGAAEGSYPVKIKSSKLSDINIYPNPSTASFTLSADNMEHIEAIKIFDALGKEVEHINKVTNNMTFGSELLPNIYAVTIYGEKALRSFIIQKN